MLNIKHAIVGVLLVAVGVVGGAAYTAQSAEPEVLTVSKETPEAASSEVIADTVVVTTAKYIEDVTEYSREYLEAEIAELTKQRDFAQTEINKLESLLSQLE